MKLSTFLVYSFLVLQMSNLYGQTINGIQIKDIAVEYIEIVGESKLLSNGIVIEVDFGQRSNSMGKQRQVRDEFGKKVEFNSMIDALNFMTKNGYEFVQAYAYSRPKEDVTRYLLKRKKLSH